MMNETLDYFIYKGDRIELKVISHKKNNLEPIIFLHEVGKNCERLSNVTQ